MEFRILDIRVCVDESLGDVSRERREHRSHPKRSHPRQDLRRVTFKIIIQSKDEFN